MRMVISKNTATETIKYNKIVQVSEFAYVLHDTLTVLFNVGDMVIFRSDELVGYGRILETCPIKIHVLGETS